jgi:hypothetical protein
MTNPILDAVPPVIQKNEFQFYRPPVYAWECQLFGCGKSIVLQRAAGQQPNAFWRLMQHLILGNKWRRL